LGTLPLEDVLKKLAALIVRTVEFATGNYSGDPHCKLSMLHSEKELIEFKRRLDDHGFSIRALSCHGNPLLQRSQLRRNVDFIQGRTLPAERTAIAVWERL
jgi:sugar phosphate isomerase/epimerase